MKTRKIGALLLSSLSLSLVACGKEDTGKTNGGTIQADLLSKTQLGEGFDESYLPAKEKIEQRSGVIDVNLDLEGESAGWDAVAREYERLQGGAVKVNVDKTRSGSAYQEALQQQLQNPKTDWDIVQGNLGGSYTFSNCINLSSYGREKNYYLGLDQNGEGREWKSVCDDITFLNVESGRPDDVYMLNSENMQTCFFVNEVALQAAKNQGWKNQSGKGDYPETWDDLIALCAAMEKAGYTNPLGMSLSDASIHSGELSWLIRIYGDYFYRQFYYYSANSHGWENYDPTAMNPESALGYTTVNAVIANLMFDEDTLEHYSENDYGYIGFGNPDQNKRASDIAKDFISNFLKMKGHFVQNVSREQKDIREEFRLQTAGKASAQIFLDYLGNGLSFKKKDADFSLGYFDYPTMGSELVDSSTLTRDIGGNGGFLSIVSHPGNPSQTALNKDFLEFFLSPYGQTVYYQGLATSDTATPKGLTTVNNSLVSIPSRWKDYFSSTSSTIKFNGNVDGNPFLSWGVRYFKGMSESERQISDCWKGLLMEGIGSGTLNVDQFCEKWGAAIYTDFKSYCSSNGWKADDYKNPYHNK